MANLSITHIRKLSEKYGVNIHLFFGDKQGAIVFNKHEVKKITIGFDKNLVEQIEAESKKIFNNNLQRRKRINSRLNSIDVSLFPKEL